MDADRFEFGQNWRRFLAGVNDTRVHTAMVSLQNFLGAESLEGLRFLDIGCGSGLFSLAARRLGASVRSFDFDPESVATTRELKRLFAAEDPFWVIDQGSILDLAWMQALGEFDVVYAWGVLHHTGDMRQAFENTVPLVRPGGRLFLSIYNDQGRSSERWRWLKRTYVRLPRWVRLPYLLLVMGPRELRSLAYALVRGRLGEFVSYRRHYAEKSLRGMSYWHDLVDWCGGYPFEVAAPEVVFDFFRDHGFLLECLQTCGGGLGCNQFVFRRNLFPGPSSGAGSDLTKTGSP